MMRRVLVLEHDDSLCLFILAKSGTAGTARLGQCFCPCLSRGSELRTPACSPHSSSSLQRNKTSFLSIKNCYLFLHRIFEIRRRPRGQDLLRSETEGDGEADNAEESSTEFKR